MNLTLFYVYSVLSVGTAVLVLVAKGAAISLARLKISLILHQINKK